MLHMLAEMGFVAAGLGAVTVIGATIAGDRDRIMTALRVAPAAATRPVPRPGRIRPANRRAPAPARRPLRAAA